MPAARALSSPSGGAKGQKNSDGDSKIFWCIFFTLNTYQETFISDILWNNLKSYGVTDELTEGQTDVKSEIVI